MGSGVTTTDTEVVAAETEWEKGVCLYKQETRVDVYGGLFQNHYYTPQYSTKIEADPF